MSGDVLVSHTVPRAVPSALKGLTSGFGMEPGVSLSLWPPKLYGVMDLTRNWSPTVTRELHSGRKTLNVETSTRPISIGQLRALLHFHIRPITQ